MMRLLLSLLFVVISRYQAEAATFNVAFAAGVEARIESLLNEPWTRVLDPLAASYNSRWSYVYDGDDVTTGLRNNELVNNYVHDNETISVFWILSKPTDISGTPGFDFIYVGYEDGKHFGYKLLDDTNIVLFYMENGNATCPEHNIDIRCRYTYSNSTSQVTGKAIGPPTLYETYDPRVRPWYIQAQSGKLWSEPYVFAEDEELGITAMRSIISDTDQFLGVFAVDYDLSTIDTTLYELVLASGGDDTQYVVFVVESNGKMIASSIAGASVQDIDGTPTQVSAVNCSVDVISEVSRAIVAPSSEGGGGGWASANGTILIREVEGKGRYWAQSQKVINSYGLHWYVVVAEPVFCDVGYYVPMDNILAGCQECPDGGVCLGGTYMPYPQEGYWVDRSAYIYGGKFYPCVYSTCKGYKESDKTLSCWTEFGFNHSRCHNKDYDFDGDDEDDPLICKKGSTGPLCGYCAEGYHYSSGSTICLSCEDNQALMQLVLFWTLVFISLFVLAIVVMIRHQKKHNKEAFENNSCLKLIDDSWLKLLKYPPLNLLKHIDRGMAKVVWVTAQILSTIPWNLSVTYPDPFSSLFVSKLQYFQLDFVPWKCFEDTNNFLTKVYIISFTPILLALLDFIVYLLRCYANGMQATSLRLSEFGTSTGSKITSQHAYVALLLSYLVLPVCSLVQFSALTCVTLEDGTSYLKADTSIDCNSLEYKQFVIVDICLIIAYQSVPLIWLYLLWQVKYKLNPELNVDEKAKTIQDRFLSTSTMVRRTRNEDYSIHYLSFLWQDYQPSKWWFEVFEMYRRTVFVAVIPLLGGDGQLRSIFGTLLSMVMVAFLSEAAPFISKITNSMLIVAQYQILFTFFVAVIISADALQPLHTSNEVVGLMLIGVNVLIIFIVIGCSSARLIREMREAKWRKAIDDNQLAILNECMENLDASNKPLQQTGDGKSSSNSKSNNGSRGSGGGAFKRRSVESVLKRYILKPQDIKLEKRVGAGAFGEVFKGKCVGQPVAIKTMIDVTEISVINFRSEILMTAMLRHPNIVNFVGACWGRDLICLVLEWVPNGTLSEFLANSSEGHLAWSQPLLRLAIDIARGMTFLQEFTYFDEVDGRDYTGIIHGDLSPNNCMVGEFATVKIGDFGTAHANVSHKKHQCLSATPIFAAPELFKGNEYSEKVDVYSFGMILAYLAINGKLVENIVDKWRANFMSLNLATDENSPRLISSFSNKPSYLSNRFSGSSTNALTSSLSMSSSHHSGRGGAAGQGGGYAGGGDGAQPYPTSLDNSPILAKVLKSINEDGWEIFGLDDNTQQCAPVVYELISKCCNPDPSKRPSFAYVMNYLLNKCEEELSSIHIASAASHRNSLEEGSLHDDRSSSGSYAATTKGNQKSTLSSNDTIPVHTNIDDQGDDDVQEQINNQFQGNEVLRQSHQIRPSLSFKMEVEMAPSHI